MLGRAAWLLILAIGCDVPPPGEPADGPRVLGSDPPDGETDVDRRPTLRVFFDRPLHPRDIHRGRVLVESGTRGVFVLPRFEPVARELWIEPQSVLDPSVTYRLRVEAIRDLDGRAMAEPWVATFETGEETSDPAPLPSASWADVAPIFEGCASDGCHASERPALGLDLSSAEAVRRTAIGVAAEQSRVGVQADQPWVASTLAGLARVDVVASVGRPARSYLLYKVLADPHVVGQRMPPPPAAPLSHEEASLLSWWILAGAPTD